MRLIKIKSGNLFLVFVICCLVIFNKRDEEIKNATDIVTVGQTIVNKMVPRTPSAVSPVRTVSASLAGTPAGSANITVKKKSKFTRADLSPFTIDYVHVRLANLKLSDGKPVCDFEAKNCSSDINTLFDDLARRYGKNDYALANVAIQRDVMMNYSMIQEVRQLMLQQMADPILLSNAVVADQMTPDTHSVSMSSFVILEAQSNLFRAHAKPADIIEATMTAIANVQDPYVQEILLNNLHKHLPAVEHAQ